MSQAHAAHTLRPPKWASLGVVLAATLITSCSRSNNLLLGRVEAVVGNHTVVVTDCYRTRVPIPQEFSDGTNRFVPCRDAEVVIRREELVVNGKSYGLLKANDGVLVDHRRRLHHEQRTALASLILQRTLQN